MLQKDIPGCASICCGTRKQEGPMSAMCSKLVMGKDKEEMGKLRMSHKHKVENWFFHIVEGNSKENVPKIFN